MSDPATREEVAALRLEIAATKTEIFKWLVGAALFFQAIIMFVLLVALDRGVHGPLAHYTPGLQ